MHSPPQHGGGLIGGAKHALGRAMQAGAGITPGYLPLGRIYGDGRRAGRDHCTFAQIAQPTAARKPSSSDANLSGFTPKYFDPLTVDCLTVRLTQGQIVSAWPQGELMHFRDRTRISAIDIDRSVLVR